MVDQTKVIIAEKNGVELDFHEEYELKAANVPFDNSTNGYASDEVQSAIEESRSSSVGKTFQLTYQNNGSTANSWCKHTDPGIASNEAPGLIPYTCRLTSITFSQANRNSDFEIRAAISNQATTNADIDRSYKWSVDNKRTGKWSNETTGFTVNPGDRIGVYILDQGGNANDLTIDFHFVITGVSDGKITSNYTGDMSSGDFPGTIPDFFS